MKKILTISLLFVAQVIFCVWGSNHIFLKEANPFAVILVTLVLSYYCLEVLYTAGTDKALQASPDTGTAKKILNRPGFYAFWGAFILFTAYEELRKLWLKYPEPVKISDVLPQLQWQNDLFFSGQFPYQKLILPTHEPYPVYMPLHWSPIQLSHLLHTDIRWSGYLLLMAAMALAGWHLQSRLQVKQTWTGLLAMLMLVLPIWSFIRLADRELAVCLETVIAAWYLLLAAGLAAQNRALIIAGLIGAFLSRYTLLFWAPLFALLLWFYAPRKTSWIIWGSVVAAFILLFVVPFWLKDPSIVRHISDYYLGCSENSWLRPDEYTYLDGLSLNIHLREWLPGTPAENLSISRYPQLLVQALCIGFGFYMFRKKWSQRVDMYTYALVALSVMTMLFYNFSPMLFKYYMLMPLTVSAVLCWKTIAVLSKSADV